MKKLILVWLILISAVGAFAQGGQRIGQATVNAAGFLKPLPGASVLVRNLNGSAASLFSDVNLSFPLKNPFNADNNGNYYWYASPGTYLEQVCSASTPCSSFIVTVGGSGGGSAIPVSNQGTQITSAVSSLNFAGPGVAAVNSGNAVTVTIPGDIAIPVANQSSQITPGVSSFNFTGPGVTATNSGSAVTLTIPGDVAIPVSNQGSPITAGVSSFNFTGPGVTATNSGNSVTLSIPGAAGAVTAPGSLTANTITVGAGPTAVQDSPSGNTDDGTTTTIASTNGISVGTGTTPCGTSGCVSMLETGVASAAQAGVIRMRADTSGAIFVRIGTASEAQLFPVTGVGVTDINGNGLAHQLITGGTGITIDSTTTPGTTVVTNTGAATIAFSAITGGPANTTAAMVVGSGASLSTTGSGTIIGTNLTCTPSCPTLPNGVLGVTQTLGDNSQALATDAFVLANAGGTIVFPLGVSGAISSGGVPYFSSTTTLASSAAFASGSLVVGGGAGNPPVTNTGLSIVSSRTIGAISSTAPAGYNGGADTSANSAEGGVSSSGGNQTGVGGSASEGGPAIFKGGNNAATNAASKAGWAALAAGQSTGASTPGHQGNISLVDAYLTTGGSTTQWNLQCSQTAAETTADCGASPTNIIGVAQTVGTIATTVISSGDAPINASAAVTVGHTVCAGTTGGKVTDSGGTADCTTGSTVGTVKAISGTLRLFDATTVTLTSTLPVIHMKGGGGSSAVSITNNTLSNIIYCVDTSGSANTITCSPTTTFPVAYSAGQLLEVDMANTTTGATTINVAGLGAKTVVDTSGGAITTNLVAGGVYLFRYDGTNWQATGPAATASFAFPITVSGTVNATGVPCFTTTTNMASSAALGQNVIVTGSSSNCLQTGGSSVRVISGVFSGTNSTTSVTYGGGVDTTVNSALGSATLQGGNQTGAGGSSSQGGAVTVIGGNNAATNINSQAGWVAVQAGQSSGATNTGHQGNYSLVDSYIKGTTVTLWNLQCSQTIAEQTQDCGASPTNIIGVAETVTGPGIAVISGGDSPINASASVTLGHTVCAGTTAGKVTDSGGTGDCTTGQTIGTVKAVSATMTLWDGTVVVFGSTLPLIHLKGGGGSSGGSFTAAGDLSGSSSTQTVIGINGTLLSGLATGILKNTTTSGVPSIATAADMAVPLVATSVTGTANAILIAMTPALAAQTQPGIVIRFTPTANNTTTTPTANVSGLGSLTIKKKSSTGLVAVAAGDIVSAQSASLELDTSGSGAWVLTNPQITAAGTSTGTNTINVSNGLGGFTNTPFFKVDPTNSFLTISDDGTAASKPLLISTSTGNPTAGTTVDEQINNTFTAVSTTSNFSRTLNIQTIHEGADVATTAGVYSWTYSAGLSGNSVHEHAGVFRANGIPGFGGSTATTIGLLDSIYLTVGYGNNGVPALSSNNGQANVISTIDNLVIDQDDSTSPTAGTTISIGRQNRIGMVGAPSPQTGISWSGPIVGVAIGGGWGQNQVQATSAWGILCCAAAPANTGVLTGAAEFIGAVPVALTLTSVANASGGSTVYTGTITGGGSNALVGNNYVISGFTTTTNNSTTQVGFVCTASTTTTLTLTNAGGVAETHAAVATLYDEAVVNFAGNSKLIFAGNFDLKGAADALVKITGSGASTNVNSAESDGVRVDYIYNHTSGTNTMGPEIGFYSSMAEAGSGSTTALASQWAFSGKAKITSGITAALGGIYNCDTVTTGSGTWTAGPYCLYNNNSNEIIFSLGNVGIGSGKTAPATALDVNGTVNATNFTLASGNLHTVGYSFGDAVTGSTLTTSEVGYITMPFACTIKGWHIMADSGTATIKTARVNGGTALPTIGSNSISTSGVSLSTGTKVDSSTVTDFISTALAANDTLGFFITAVSGAKQISFQVDCQ